MSAANHIANALRNLEALRTLLEDAAARGASLEQLVDEAMVHLEEATRILESMTDDEGTE